jgi:nucleoside-diphosphate-sugar epimerase
MTKQVIGITGATGFIGSALADYLSKCGYTIIAFVRDIDRATSLAKRYDLADEIPEGLFKGVDILIHCAFVELSNNAEAETINYEGTKRLVKASKQDGVKKIIFFSSVSAKANSTSAYGRSKHKIHSLLIMDQDVILKCSLVIGNGGLFYRLLEHTLKFRMVPVFEGGRQIVQVVVIEDVLKIVEKIIFEKIAGIYTLTNTELHTYKSVFREIAAVFGIKVFFVPINSGLVSWIVRFSRLFGVPSPISEENIRGLKDLEIVEVSPNLQADQTLREKLIQLRNDRF